jgi:PAS domain S-box-containing protein
MRWLPGEGEPGQLGIIADSAAGVIDARGCSTGAGSTGAGSRGGGFNDGAERTLRGTVLLADDNADLREYVSGLLQSRGYEVAAVGNGGAALAAAQARRPDLILTDVMMPVMDGFALLNAIRAAPSLADVPVIMLSARAGEEAQVEGLQAGADDYLAKPFSARELLARVAANLDIARTRREAGHAIRASEARLRGVLEGMTEGFALLDANFRIIEINAQGLRMEARPKEFLLGKTHWEVYPGSQASELGLLYQRAMRDRVPVSLEHEYTWPENRRAWIDMRAYPTDDGGLAIFYRDVTDRRQALDALRHLNESLERRIAEAVAEREAVLVRLNETQRLETLGQLTGGVAHDFNNLLTPIMGALDLLRRRHEDERSQRLISGAMQSAERAKTLVGRLLAFARRQTLEPQPVDPGALLEGLRDLISHSVGPAIEVCLDIPDHLPPALVDPSQLELALLNLAVNARDAMDSGGTLTITAAADVVAAGVVPGLAPGRYIRFQVTDTGCGMDEATLARAVEPFFTTKDIGKGTGLGLSMVHGLALQSGGTMRLTSAFGAGTTAALWLPVSSGGAVGIAKQNEDAPRAGRQAMLLLVDDEELVRATTAALMIELGYDVVEAASAAAALEKVRAGLLPDLVVTDHMMPGMTGAQLVSALREKIAGIPALIISGYANLQSEGAFDAELLTKPFTFADLAKRVAMLLTPQSGHAGAVPE